MSPAAADIWLSADEIAQAKLPGMPSSKRAVNSLAERAGWAEHARRREARGGGLEYPITVLPLKTQRALIGIGEPVEKRLKAVVAVSEWIDAGRSKAEAAREVSRVHGITQASLFSWLASVEDAPREEWAERLCPPAESAREAMKAANALKTNDALREDGLAEMSHLSEQQRAEVQAKAALLQAINGLEISSGLSRTQALGVFVEAWNAGEDDFRLGEDVRATLPRLSARSLKRWRSDFTKGGLAALAPKHGQHRKGKGKLDGSDPMRTLIEAMLLQYPDSSAKLAMRALRARFAEGQIPSYRTVQRWMEAWRQENAALYEMARSPDGYRSKMRLVAGKADENVLRLNQRWEMDSTPNDVILNDGKRHALIGVVDVWSRRARILVSRTSSAAGVAACLRRAILEWGMPEEIKTDNGADYISAHIKQLCLGLEIHQEVCPPFSPEKKPHIERFFGTFTRDIVGLLPGFVGHNVSQRKQIEDREAFQKRLGSSKEEPPKLALSSKELQEFCDTWCETMYEREAHSSIGMSPFARAQSWTGPVRRITNERALDILLMPVAGDNGTRSVTKRGIQLEHHFYTDPALQPFVGQRVFVFSDEEDWGRLLVRGKDGAFICWALCPERAGVSKAEAAAYLNAKTRESEREARAWVREVKRKTKIETIASDIIEGKRQEASKVISFPGVRSDVPHETPALKTAAKAADERGKPRLVERDDTAPSEADLAAFDERRKEQSTPEETPAQRFRRWEKLDAQIGTGKEVTSERESLFWRTYQRSAEFGLIRDEIKAEGRDAVLGRDEKETKRNA